MAARVHYIDLPPPPWDTSKVLNIKCQYGPVYTRYTYAKAVADYLVSPFVEDVTCRNCLKKMIKELKETGE